MDAVQNHFLPTSMTNHAKEMVLYLDNEEEDINHELQHADHYQTPSDTQEHFVGSPLHHDGKLHNNEHSQHSVENPSLSTYRESASNMYVTLSGAQAVSSNTCVLTASQNVSSAMLDTLGDESIDFTDTNRLDVESEEEEEEEDEEEGSMVNDLEVDQSVVVPGQLKVGNSFYSLAEVNNAHFFL